MNLLLDQKRNGKECKYDVKNILKSRPITDKLEKSASDESDNEPDSDSDDGSDDDDEKFFRKLDNIKSNDFSNIK